MGPPGAPFRLDPREKCPSSPPPPPPPVGGPDCMVDKRVYYDVYFMFLTNIKQFTARWECIMYFNEILSEVQLLWPAHAIGVAITFLIIKKKRMCGNLFRL